MLHRRTYRPWPEWRSQWRVLAQAEISCAGCSARSHVLKDQGHIMLVECCACLSFEGGLWWVAGRRCVHVAMDLRTDAQ
jgi:hypothetical protein